MDAVLLGKMLDAGFTKSEILSMIGTQDSQPAETQDQDQQQETQQEQTQEQQQETQQEQTQEQQQETTGIETRLNGIETSIKDLMKQFQQENLKRDSFENPQAESLESQTDKIMASIIRPEKGSA